eukprot:scaffold17986_cov45-Phaeocystis_antarctica.AAC.1
MWRDAARWGGVQVILRSAQKPTDYDTVAVALCTLFIERKHPFRYGGTPPPHTSPCCSLATRSSTFNCAAAVTDANRISCLWLARRYTAAYRVRRRGAPPPACAC